MTAFQQFRLWARRAPWGERSAAGAAGAVILAVLVFLLVPTSNSSKLVSTSSTGSSGGAASGGGALSSGTGAGGGSISSAGGAGGGSGAAAAGSATPGAAGGRGGGASLSASGGQVSPGSVPGGGGGSGPGSGTGPATATACAPSNAQGVSGSQIKIAVTLTDIIGPAGNSTFNVAPVSEQQAAYQASVDAINRAGGVDCRKLAPLYYTVNPVDSSDLEQKCLEISQAGVFAVLDTGGVSAIAGGADCYGQRHIPFFTAVAFPGKVQSSYYPYMFGFGTLDHLYHDTVFAFKQRGVFTSPSFQKLGIFYRDCFPELYSEEVGWLHQVGLSDAQIVKYDVGCPSALASPSSIEQAVLTFQSSHVSHLTIINEQGDFATFTKIAQQQGFRPHYVLPDDQDLIADSYGSTAPDPNNLANALAIANNRDGENTTPGATPTAGTARCNTDVQAKGLQPVYQDPAAIGNACDSVWELVDAIANAPVFSAQALAAGLQRAGTIDYSYPQGPSNYAPSLNGEQFWRVAQWYTSCACWRLIDQTFHPSFPGSPDPAYH